MKKILLIGAGPTSSLIAYNLRQLGLTNQLQVHIWEKSRGVGGRFATSRSPKSSDCFADLGAQYLTLDTRIQWARPYFNKLEEDGVIQKFNPDGLKGFRTSNCQSKDYVCIKGSASVVKHFLQAANIKNVSFNKKVSKLQINGDKIQVSSEGAESAEETFDIVISTMPVPQILQLQNADDLLLNLSHDQIKLLKDTEYSSRYALGLFYNQRLKLAYGETEMNYVENDDKIRYWSLEDQKRKLGSETGNQESASAVVVHTSVPFAVDHLETDVTQVAKILLPHVKENIAALKDIEPEHVKCHRWRYSQVTKGYKGSPGCITISQSPLIIAAGDGFSYSGLQGCILSAEKTIAAIRKHLDIIEDE